MRRMKFIDRGDRVAFLMQSHVGLELRSDTRCPVLVVRARQATTFEPTDLVRLAAIDRVQLREVDAGHDLIGEDPAAFVAELSDWLQASF